MTEQLPAGWVERSDDPTRLQVTDSGVGSSPTLDPTYGRSQRSVRVVTLGCRLNAFESEVMRRHAAAAGLEDAVIVNTCAVTAEAVRQAGQTIRKLRRENPGARLIVTGCAAQIEPAALRRHAGGRSRPRQRREDGRRRRFRGLSLADSPRVAGQRHHVGARDRARAGRRLRLARARLRAGAERLRPPLHLLHHSLWPRAVALGAGRRGGGAACAGWSRRATPRSCSPASTSPPTAPTCRATMTPGQARAPDPAPRAGARAPAPLLHRPGRGRRAPDGRHRRGAAPDAASAPLAAVGRRHDPQAHEAAPLRAPTPSASARACGGCGPTSCSAPT